MTIRNGGQSGAQQVAEEFLGPLPPPGLLAAYEAVSPGFTQKIIQLAEKETEHRRAFEEKVLNSQKLGSTTGKAFALALFVISISASVYFFMHGAVVAGEIMGGAASLTSFVAGFLVARFTASDASPRIATATHSGAGIR